MGLDPATGAALGGIGGLTTGLASIFQQKPANVIQPQVPEPSVPAVGQGQSLQPQTSLLPMQAGQNFQSILQFLGRGQ